jgi:hypothetical protein
LKIRFGRAVETEVGEPTVAADGGNPVMLERPC